MSEMRPPTLLVHGGGLDCTPEGWVLGRSSVARAELAVQLFYAGGASHVIFTGGNGHGHDLPVSEGQLMADVAVQAGVPHRQVECEDQSHSTIGNWANAVPIMRHIGTEQVVGVTGSLASVRARYIGQRIIEDFGVEAELIGYYPSREREGVAGLFREQVAMIMARRCLNGARSDDIPLAQLDTYYADRKPRPLVRIKELL